MLIMMSVLSVINANGNTETPDSGSPSGSVENGSYISPYVGTYGIPIDSAGFRPIDENAIWKDGSYKDFMSSISTNGGNYYGDFSMVGIGGVGNIKNPSGWKSYTVTIRLTAMSPDGLYFVSLSNPTSVRPYQLAVVTKYRDVYTAQIDSKTGPFGVLNKSGEPLDLNIKLDYDLSEYWFDLVLILPGTWDGSSDTIADSNHVVTDGYNYYPLVKADDYSSVLTLKLELFVNGKPVESATKTITYPLNGYYNPDENLGILDQAVGMHVLTTSNCANLDINNQQGQYVKIADINFLSRDVAPVEDIALYPQDFPPPFVGGPKPSPEAWPNWPVHTGGNNKGKPITKAPSATDYVSTSDPAFSADSKLWKDWSASSSKAEYDKAAAEWDTTNDAYLKWEENNAKFVAQEKANRNYIFLSSSSDPFNVDAEPFILIHESKPFDTAVSVRNSIKFDLIVRDKDDPNQIRSFDGSTYYDTQQSTDSQLWKLLVSHPEPSFLQQQGFHAKNQYNHTFRGEVYLVMENKPDTPMIKGRYQEEIFVHVIAP